VGCARDSVDNIWRIIPFTLTFVANAAEVHLDWKVIPVGSSYVQHGIGAELEEELGPHGLDVTFLVVSGKAVRDTGKRAEVLTSGAGIEMKLSLIFYRSVYIGVSCRDCKD